MWGYYDLYTAAQIDLMVVDAPIVVYPKRHGKDSGPKKANPVDVMRKAMDWEKKYGDGRAEMSLDFSSFMNKNNQNEQ